MVNSKKIKGGQVNTAKTVETKKKSAPKQKVGKKPNKAKVSIKKKQIVQPKIEKKKEKDKKVLSVRFLGGVGEIGKNMTVLEYGNDIIVIDGEGGDLFHKLSSFCFFRQGGCLCEGA